MKGYFSRLIQQTGITFGPAGNFSTDPLESPSVRSKELNGTSPVHVEDEKMVGPITESTGKVHENVREGFKYSVLHTENENIKLLHIGEKRPFEPQTEQSAREVHGEVNEGVKHSVLHNESDRTQNLTVKRYESKPSEEAIELRLEGGKLEQSYEGNELFMPKKLPTSHEINHGKSRKNEGIVESMNKESRNEPPSKHNAESDNQPAREQTWRTTFEEIREWVAETPVEGIEGIHNRNTVKIIDVEREAPPLPDQGLTSAASQPRPIEPRQRKEPEVQDFHLSIGTINLTIEEPQKEIQRSEPLQTRRSRESIKENNSSSLDRHYIRIRW